jgi:catalase (peroxidase I)
MDLVMTFITSRLICDNSNYATMRFEPESIHGANNGLQIARGLMEEIKKEFDWISYGDLWTLAGVAAIQVSGLHTRLGIEVMAHPQAGNGRT